jgi:hypothetical protein
MYVSSYLSGAAADLKRRLTRVTFASLTAVAMTTSASHAATYFGAFESGLGFVQASTGTSNGLQTLSFIVSLTGPVVFVDTGSHDAFDFNLSPAAVGPVQLLSAAGFKKDGTTFTNNGTQYFSLNPNPAGAANGFQLGLACSGFAGSGANSCGSIDALTFTIAAVSLGALTNFAADVFNSTTGSTGFIFGSVTPPNPVPLPGAVVLMGTILAGGAGFARWRKKRGKRDGAIAAV